MSYSVTVTVTSQGATYVLQVAQGDDTPGNVAAAYGLADPLRITQRLQSNPRGLLAHPEPEEATVTLIAPDSTTYKAMSIGDPVGIQVYPQAAFAGTPVEFYGRIASLAANPHPLGVQLTLSCVDYTADLAEVEIGLVAYPVEMALDRLNRMLDEVNIPHTPRIPAGWTFVLSPVMAARAAGATDLYSALIQLLDSWTFTSTKDETMTALPVTFTGQHLPSYRPYLVPKITGGLLDQANPYQIRVGSPWTRRAMYAPPGRVTNVAGTRSVTMAAADSSPSTGAPILDAGKVEFALAFTQTKGDQLPNVTVGIDAQGNRYTWDWRAYHDKWATGGGTVGAGGLQPPIQTNPQGPPITQELDSILDVTDAFSAATSPSGIVQAFRSPYRPDSRSNWAIGTLSYQAWADSPWRRPELTELLGVARGAAGKLPNNREWVAGCVQATTLAIAKGRPTIDVDTMPPNYDFVMQREQKGATLGVCSLDSPVLTGVTLAQLNARDTFDDYAITRGS